MVRSSRVFLVALVATTSLAIEPKCTMGSFFVQKAGLRSRVQSFEHGNGHEQAVLASVAADGQSATVSILLGDGNNSQTYQLEPTDVISANADLVAVVDGQDVSIERLSPKNQFFSSNRPGEIAKASIDEDGQVLGLFQHGTQMLRVMPLGSMDNDGPPMLLETDARLHHVRVIDFNDQKEQQQQQQKDEEADEDHGASNEPRLAVDDDHGDDSVLQPVDGDLMPSMESGVEAAWGGTKWFPGCFPGDKDLHIMKIGLAADVQAFKDIKSRANLRQILEQIVHESNIIYENQLNIRLEVGAIRIYETSSGAPAWANGCSDMNTKLDGFTKTGVPQLPSMADWQLFTGCGTGSGVVGLAWMGTLCHQRGYNSGVNQLITYAGSSVSAVVDRTWRIFAHELGHNFAADHSFEDGQQRTGGIMDYGDGKLNGVYQFNTKYRKAEVCRHVAQRKQSGQCGSNFKAGGGGGGGGGGGNPTPRPRPRPTPRPTPPSGGNPVLNRGKDCWGNCWPGPCSWCGRGNLCCRRGWNPDPQICKGVPSSEYITSHHECVRGPSSPTPAPPRPTPPPATPRPTPRPATPPTPGPKPPCRDIDDRCATKWKGKCSKKHVQKKCPQSCDLCGSPGDCKDTSGKCQTKWKNKCGKGKIKAKCPLTCGVCSSNGSS